MGYDWSMEDLSYSKRGAKCLKRKRSFPGIGVTAEELCAKEKDFFAKLPKEMEKLEIKVYETLKKAGIQGVVTGKQTLFFHFSGYYAGPVARAAMKICNHAYSLVIFTLTGRIKSLQSLINKMNENKITDVRQITDIVALRVTLQTMSDISAFKQAILIRHDEEITEIRCYGTCGPNIGIRDMREKRYWPMRESGYRRLHFKVRRKEMLGFLTYSGVMMRLIWPTRRVRA